MIEYVGEKFQGVLLWFLNLFLSSDNEVLGGPAHEFADPLYLLLLLFIPAYLVWYFWFYEPRRLVVPLSYDPSKLAPSKIPFGFLRVAPHVLNNLALFLMVISLARPVSNIETDVTYTDGIDIMLVLDTSGSMETQDFSPNRLEVAKKMSIQFIEGRKNDRIGVVVFAQDAYAYVPLTLDYPAVIKQIKSISSNMMPKEGTAMGSAIGAAINRFKESDNPSQVMILLTDGKNRGGQIDPITAADMARLLGIKIYSIGIGKREWVQQSRLGPQTMISDLDEETLQEISKLTGGQFFRSTDERSLETIFNQISQMETKEIEEIRYREDKDLYPPILFLGGLLLGISFLIMITFIYNPLEG